MTHIGALGVLEVVLSLWKCLSLFEVIKNNNNNNERGKCSYGDNLFEGDFCTRT